MPYSPSIPLTRWLTVRRADIDTLAKAHAYIGEVDGPGRPLSTGRPVGRAYVLHVVAEFQGFVRDLHDLAAQRLVELAGPKTPFVSLLSEAATANRSIDRGNADLRSIRLDFRRVGLVNVVSKIGSVNRQWSPSATRKRGDQANYGDLIELRNALAHGNQNQVDALRAKGSSDTVSWARQRLPGLDRTARALDKVVWDHLHSISGEEPW